MVFKIFLIGFWLYKMVLIYFWKKKIKSTKWLFFLREMFTQSVKENLALQIGL